jgi:hypothetical protein
MAYITNPVYRGVGSVDAVDRDSALIRNSNFKGEFAQAYQMLERMSTAQVMTLNAKLKNVVQQLPQGQQKQIQTAADAAMRNLDVRTPYGLGMPAGAVAAAAGAADWTAKLANIAGVIASLTTVGLGVANFIETKKTSKAQAESQARNDAMAAKQAQMDIDARKQNLAIQKQQADALAKQQSLEAAGMTVDAEGNPIKKPTSPLATAGALAAAVTGAFLISK